MAEHKPDYDADIAALGEIAEQSGGREMIVSPLNEAVAKASKKSRLGAIISSSSIVSMGLGLLGFALTGIIPLIIAAVITVGLNVTAIIILAKAADAKKAAISALENTAREYNTNAENLADRIDDAIRELARMRTYNAENARLIAELELAEEGLEASKKRAYTLLSLTLGESAEPDCRLLDSEAERLSAFLDEYDALAREEDAFLRMLENERNQLARYNEERLRNEITVKIEDATPEAVEEAERSKSFLLAKKNAYESKITLLQNELIALRIKAEDPMPIADRLALLEEKNKKDREFYNALLLAMNVIEDSSAAMRGNVTPIISKTASELMARMSNDKYNILRTNAHLGVMLDKDGFGVSSELLSAGTKDTAYIALRLALIMQIYANEHPPIIFDETFCQLDDKRLSSTVELLYSLAGEGMQIILFTSHKREAECCKEAGYDYNEITL